MKRLLIILGFISAILATIVAVTPLFKLAVFPLIIAFACGIGIILLSKKKGFKTKSTQYIFLLVIISLSLTVYKAIFNKTELGDTEQLEQRDQDNLEDSKNQLEDIEIDY